MQTLFERDARGTVDCDDALLRNAAEMEDMDMEFAKALLDGVLGHEQEIKDSVSAHAPGWTLDRMDPIARCVLLLASEELIFRNDAPPAVVMNEAIEIAKEFGTDESGKFVNGVLNAIAKERDPAPQQ